MGIQPLHDLSANEVIPHLPLLQIPPPFKKRKYNPLAVGEFAKVKKRPKKKRFRTASELGLHI